MTACEREAAIEALYPVVRRIARRVSRILTSIDVDDLIGEGSLGAIRAVDSYDPRRGTRLPTYARRLILGSMLNVLRRTDPVSERIRRRIRLAEAKRYRLAQELGRLPSMQEMESEDPRLRDARVTLHRLTPLSTDAPQAERDPMMLLDWSGEASRLALQSLERAALAAAVRGLSPRQREVVGLHYYADMSLHAIGHRLRITPQRACQLHASALARLRVTVSP